MPPFIISIESYYSTKFNKNMKIIQCMRFSFECAGVRRAAGRIDARGAWPVTQGYVRHTKNPPARPGDFSV